MNTIERAYEKNPTMATVAIAMFGFIVAVAATAAVIYIPNFFSNPLQPPSQTATDLSLFAVLVMLACGMVLVANDIKSRGGDSTSANPFALPRVMVGIQFIMGTSKTQLIWAV